MKPGRKQNYLRTWCGKCQLHIQGYDPDRIKATRPYCPQCQTPLAVLATGGIALKGYATATKYDYGDMANVSNDNQAR